MRVPDALTYDGVQLGASVAVAATRLFLPNVARQVGASVVGIGLISAATNLAVLVSTFVFSRRTDVEGSKRYLHVGLCLSAVTVALIFVASDVLSLLVTFAVAGFAMGMYPAPLIKYVFGKQVRLGRFSAVGSLGAGLGWLLAGYFTDHLTFHSVFLVGALFFGLAFGVSLRLPPIPLTRHVVPFFPKALFRRFLPIFVPYLVRHLAANVVWVIYPLYLQSLGLDYTTIALLYTLNPFAQFLVMATITDRVAASRLMAVGLTLSSAAFATMALSSAVWHIVVIQLLIAAAWSCLYVGALRQVTDHDVRKATTTGLLTLIINVGNIVGPLVGGVIAEVTGTYQENMVIATLVTALAVPLYFRFNKASSPRLGPP